VVSRGDGSERELAQLSSQRAKISQWRQREGY